MIGLNDIRDSRFMKEIEAMVRVECDLEYIERFRAHGMSIDEMVYVLNYSEDQKQALIAEIARKDSTNSN